ncbi:MAG: hypothetical protein ACQEQA_04490 [Bacillota bacterium]
MGSILDALGQSYRITKDALNYIFSHPKMLVPTFLIKVLYVAGYFAILLFTPLREMVLGEAGLSLLEMLLILYLTIVYFRFFEGLIALVTLHLVKQQSEEHTMSLLKALGGTLGQSLLRAFPIILFWAFIEFFIAVVFAFIKAALRGKDGNSNPLLEGTANRTQRFLNNMLDRVSMLSFPVIIWDKKGTLTAIKESMAIFKSKVGVVLGGAIIGRLFYLLMAVPAAIVFFAADYFGVVSGPLLIGIVVYALVIWSIKYLIEVLFTTKIYLWHRAWSNARIEAYRKGETEPNLEDIPQPNLLSGYSSVFLDVKFNKDSGPEPMSQY